MRAVRVTETARVDVAVQDREVRWMKDAVPDADQGNDGVEPAEARHHTDEERSAGDKRDAGQQDGPGAEAIDRKAGDELRDAARNVEHADESPERGKRDAKFLLQQWKQRRQRKLEEMRHGMCK